MPAWETFALTLSAGAIGAAIGAGAALFGGWRQRRADRDMRRIAEARELREKGAAVVGPLLALLDQVEPLALGLFVRDETFEYLDDVFGRLRLHREQLAIYGAAHPSPDVGRKAADAGLAVAKSLNATGWFLRGLKEHTGHEEERLYAEGAYEDARSSVQDLLAEIRGDGGGRTGATRPTETGRDRESVETAG